MATIVENETRIDTEAILDRVGGDASLLREIAGIFLQEYPELLETMQRAVGSGDASLLERSAHSLKGAASNFCEGGVTETAYKLELLGRQRALADAPPALDALRVQLASLQEALERLAR